MEMGQGVACSSGERESRKHLWVDSPPEPVQGEHHRRLLDSVVREGVVVVDELQLLPLSVPPVNEELEFVPRNVSLPVWKVRLEPEPPRDVIRGDLDGLCVRRHPMRG
jgi:hypothetical protein